MRIGTAPISWGACEIPDWGQQIPWPRVLDEMRDTGYDGTELGPWGFLPTDPQVLRRELADRSLEMIAAFCPVDLRTLDPTPALHTIALLAELGGVLVLASTNVHGARFSAEGWERACDGIDRIARQAKARGIVTAFHPHADTYVERPDDIERFLEGTDPSLVGLCLDTGHIAYGGGDPLRIAQKHIRRVKHVHLKDLRRAVRAKGGDLRAAVGRGVFAPLGRGDLDLAAIVRALKEGGYEAWLVVEQDTRVGVTPRAAPTADARANRAFLRDILEQ